MQLSSTLWALLGGGLIGVSVSLILYFNGRVTGISGIVGGLLRRQTHEMVWRLLFVLGLGSGGVFMFAIDPGAFAAPRASTAVLVVAGLLVGVGTRIGNGCTSGHGVCGTSRLSPRSIVSTLSFIAAGMATVTVVRLVGGLR